MDPSRTGIEPGEPSQAAASSLTPGGARWPEILAPAGDEESLAAALAAGADAIYFGLADGFNARARAGNFELTNLPEMMQRLHRAGVRGYLTLNTLVFESELSRLEGLLRSVALAGVDAILVQDPAVALLAAEVAPDLEVHASTQMTVSSPEGVLLARDLGMTRIVAPRELSLEELRTLTETSPLAVEVFIHGALCVSWSGQCLTSEAWGGRSANRGQCAQSCRLPYDLVVDGAVRDLGETEYLLSPRDLAGWMHIPELIRLGIASFKIEGRQKGPTYVATAVEGYRKARDRALAGRTELLEPEESAAMATSFSRGFSSGFFAGSDHQTLVDGRFPKHRGLAVGTVVAVKEREALVRLGESAPELSAGDGVVFDSGHPEAPEPGGPIFEVVSRSGGECLLRFGRPGPELGRVLPGHRVWKTADVRVARRVRQLLNAGDVRHRRPLRLAVSGQPGGPLRLAVMGTPQPIEVRSGALLAPAKGGGLDASILRDKLGRLGETAWELVELDSADLAPGLHLPVRELNEMRRSLVGLLDAAFPVTPPSAIGPEGALARLYSRYVTGAPDEGGRERALVGPQLVPLCRTMDQLEAVIAAGFGEIELDWMELVGLELAVARARAAGARVRIATLRIQKPGEEGYDARIARLEPDGLLVRHWGALEFFRRSPGGGPELHGDFSLNVANALTARFLLERGLRTFTPSHDLDAAQLLEMAVRLDPARVTIPLHHHIATFHTEHCVYAHLLSDGRDFRTCGRPCEERRVSLRDRTGQEHPVVVDVGCRNTVFNARAQSAAHLVPEFLRAGFRRFRVEFVRESGDETTTVLEAYSGLLAGELEPAAALQRVGALERFGVTGGTLRVTR